MIEYLIIILIAVLAVAYYGNSKNWSVKRYLKLVFSILASLSAGAVGSIFTIRGLEPWYEGLTKPWFAPLGEVISVIWITLYVLMGISLFIVLTEDLGESKVRLAIGAFAVQLIVNASWSFLFFGLESLVMGLVGIVSLWIAVAVTIYLFYRISKKASYLLVPYIVWVSIAMVVNVSLYLLN